MSRGLRIFGMAASLALAVLVYAVLLVYLACLRFPYLRLYGEASPQTRGSTLSFLVHAAVVLLAAIVVYQTVSPALEPRLEVEIAQLDHTPQPVRLSPAEMEEGPQVDDPAYSILAGGDPLEVQDLPSLDIVVERSGHGQNIFASHLPEALGAKEVTSLGRSLDGDKAGGRQPGRATFFGTIAEGRRFVFVVDMSGSMEGAKFLRARGELLRSVKDLFEDQEFSIVFYNHQAFPLTESELLPVTKKNMSKTITWVNRVSPIGNTNPVPALRIAMNLEPDGIFLLTDGEYPEPHAVVQVAGNQPTPKIPIHTLSFVNRVGEPVLKEIARVTNGTYRFVP